MLEVREKIEAAVSQIELCKERARSLTQCLSQCQPSRIHIPEYFQIMNEATDNSLKIRRSLKIFRRCIHYWLKSASESNEIETKAFMETVMVVFAPKLKHLATRMSFELYADSLYAKGIL